MTEMFNYNLVTTRCSENPPNIRKLSNTFLINVSVKEEIKGLIENQVFKTE